MTVQVRVTHEGLAVSGELDMASAGDFRDFAAGTVDATREVVLDISELAYLDSSGIKAIIRLCEYSCPHGLILRWPRANVQRVLDIVAIEKVVGIRVERRAQDR